MQNHGLLLEGELLGEKVSNCLWWWGGETGAAEKNQGQMTGWQASGDPLT